MPRQPLPRRAAKAFPPEPIIFLDQEEGGRMLPQQKAYIYAWVDGVAAAGFRAGIYCSGIAAKEDGGVSVVTAEDIRQNSAGRKIVYWVANDACPPSPGCAFPKRPPSPAESGIDFAEVWQFAQSPKRPDVAAGCPANYDRDGSCYPPGVDLPAALACGPEHRGQRRSFARKDPLITPSNGTRVRAFTFSKPNARQNFIRMH